MRWVFFSLLALNFGYLLLQLILPAQNGETKQKSVNADSSEAPTILLLREAEDLAQPAAIDVVSLLKKEQNLISESQDAVENVDDAAEASLCLAYGTFINRPDGEFFLSMLTEQGVGAELQEESVSSEPLYWAYIASLDSFEQALLTVNKFAQNQITAYLISEGEQVNGLSLGLFKSEDEVQDLKKIANELGFELVIQEKTDSYVHYWVAVPAADAANMNESTVARIKSDFPLIKQRQKVCKAVASQG